MSGIIEFFTSIADGVKLAIEFLINTISDIAYIVKLLGYFVLNIDQFFDWLPATCVSLIVFGFSIVVLYKILGREG